MTDRSPSVSNWLVRSAVLAAILLQGAFDVAHSSPLTFKDLMARPRPVPTKVMSYGPHAHQYGEVWLPDGGKSPYPVVLLVHGGCWLAELPATELVAYMAEDLRRRGYFVWSIDYRRIGDDQGGYPYTFLDAAQAADELKGLAKQYPIDLTRVVAVGHSAGGHLANWLAARKTLPATSRLHAEAPLAIRGVVSLAGINDLKSYRATGPDACGGPPTIDALVGAAARVGEDLYADTSPAEMLPIGTHLSVLSGSLDHIVPPAFGDAFAARARSKGDRVVSRTYEDAGHFELIDPTSKAWPGIVADIDAMVR
jgi:acetyl esterase/lipase